jgi:integrase
MDWLRARFNAILPLRVICRRAHDRELIGSNPTEKLALPKDRRRREQVPAPSQIEAHLAALPDPHQDLWSTAVFTGLRRGELQGLQWESVDLKAGVIRVERAWDRVAGPISPKSRSGERIVPLPSRLRVSLAALRGREVGRAGEHVFSRDGHRPFDPSNELRAVRRLWDIAGLPGLGFHQCRHAYASLMIAAGVNAKALSAYMGHSSITVTLDRYGHLLSGNERTAAAQLDRFLASELGEGATS